MQQRPTVLNIRAQQRAYFAPLHMKTNHLQNWLAVRTNIHLQTKPLRQSKIHLPGESQSRCALNSPLNTLIRSTRSDRGTSANSSSRKSKLFSPSRPSLVIQVNNFFAEVHPSRVPAGIWSWSENIKDSRSSVVISRERRPNKVRKGVSSMSNARTWSSVSRVLPRR